MKKKIKHGLYLKNLQGLFLVPAVGECDSAVCFVGFQCRRRLEKAEEASFVPEVVAETHVFQERDQCWGVERTRGLSGDKR